MFSSPASKDRNKMNSLENVYVYNNETNKELMSSLLLNDQWYEWHLLSQINSTIVDCILNDGTIDLNKFNYNNDTVLIQSCKNGWGQLLNLLIKHKNIDINLFNKCTGINALIAACDASNAAFVDLLLSHEKISISLNHQDNYGRTPLFYCCRNGAEECVKLLLNHPAINVNTCSKDGSSPLFVASSEGRATIVKLLLSHPGIDVNVINVNSDTALGVATLMGRTACNQLLNAYPGVKRISSDNSFFNY